MNNWQIVIYSCVSTVSPEHRNETTAYEVARPVETYSQSAWCRFIAARTLPTDHLPWWGIPELNPVKVHSESATTRRVALIQHRCIYAIHHAFAGLSPTCANFMRPQ